MNGPALDHLYGKPCSCYSCVCDQRFALRLALRDIQEATVPGQRANQDWIHQRASGALTTLNPKAEPQP